ncbi:MAG TPA: hypothetical protein VK308_11650 [Pyrinomonadaceae bacterium]|nr:hypothetical protein [Pyrinomonadaceae bacterium]
MSDKKIKPQFISVPFNASSGNGMTEYNGIAKFSTAGIVFEFDSVLLGLIGGDVKEVQVALEEILDIKFRKGIYKFFAQIQLRLQSFAKLSQLPNYSGKVKLNIKREDFELAERAVEQILRTMNENDSLMLPDKDDSPEQLPPVQTSVNELFDTEKLETNDLRETKKIGKNAD